MSYPCEILEINNWEQFFESVKRARTSLECQRPWYRGHISARYSLVPTLFRMGLTKEKSDEAERDAFELFERRVQKLRVAPEAQRDWHVLANMQHYGVPTRLLDWTSVLGIAVFFATAVHTPVPGGSDFAIYVLDPVSLNKKVGRPTVYSSEDEHFAYKSIYWQHKPFVPSGAIALETPFVNDRIFAQQGLFTVHMDDQPLEIARPDAVRKLTLHQSCAAEAKEFLHHANLNEATVFPDMEGLARYVRSQMYSLGAAIK